MFISNSLNMAVARALESSTPAQIRRSGGWIVPRKCGGHMKHKRAAMKRRAKVAHKRRGRG